MKLLSLFSDITISKAMRDSFEETYQKQKLKERKEKLIKLIGDGKIR